MTYWWLPVAVVIAFLNAVLSRCNNQDGGLTVIVAVTAVNMLPLWALVSRYSGNLIFDGMLYDTCIYLVFVGTLSILGAGQGFSTINWAGVCLSALGFILIHWKG